MNKEIVDELINLYKKTVDDNKDDILIMINIMNKLCACLFHKCIINQEEWEEILKIDKNKGDKDE